MSFNPPSVAQTDQTIRDQLSAQLGDTIPILPKAFNNVIAAVFAAVAITIYKYAGFILLQFFVRHASARPTEIAGKTVVPLFEWGLQYGEGLPLEGQRAEHTVSLRVLTTGGSLPAGQQFLHKSTGVLHESTADVSLSSATVSIPIRAYHDPEGRGGVGSIGNLSAGAELELANSPAAVAGRATVIARTVDGADPEDIESSYRPRVWYAVARPPQGGAESDYASWGRSVPGIVGIWPYEGSTPNRITVYVEATPASSGSPDGIPTGPQLAAVEQAIQFDAQGLRKRRPVGALITVLPITRKALDVRVTGLMAPNLVATKAATSSAVDEYLRQRRPWISGLDMLPVRNQATVAGIGGVVAATVYANKGTFTRVQLFETPTERHVYTLQPGELVKLGSITWVSS